MHIRIICGRNSYKNIISWLFCHSISLQRLTGADHADLLHSQVPVGVAETVLIWV